MLAFSILGRIGGSAMTISRKQRLRHGVWGVALLVMLSAVPAGAGDGGSPQITDTRGDANFWGQAFYLLDPQPDPIPDPYEGSPDTRPASFAGADLVEAWYQTDYQTVRVVQGGQVVRVRHVPTDLRVNVRTDASPAPTFGPTVWLFIPASIQGSCGDLTFHLYFLGPLSSANDQQHAVVSGSTNCGLVTGSRPLQIDEDVSSLRVPLGGALQDGAVVTTRDTGAGMFGGFGGMAAFASVPSGARPIDLAKPADPFVVGSDVPPDIDCVAAPSHPECSG